MIHSSENMNEALQVGPSSRLRRSQRKDDEEPASLFLRKAYHVVCNCPPSLGGWSTKGDTFIIKDAKKFSEKVIPTVYKHNNFSSFVRQLNFYGFRKIKSDLSSIENPFWEFRHPKFVRGMPELLSEIKKAVTSVSQVTNSTSEDTAALQITVGELREKLATVDTSISSLHRIISELIEGSIESQKSQSSQFVPNESDSPTSNKKRLFDFADSHSDPHRQHQKKESPLSKGVFCLDTTLNEDIHNAPNAYTGLIKSESASSSPPLSFEGFAGVNDYDNDDDSLDGLIHLCSQDCDYEQHFGPHLVTSNSQDSIDFDDYLSYSAIQQEQFRVRNLTPCASAFFQRSVSADEGIDSSLLRFCEQSNVDAPALLSATDIPFIMSHLPSPLHARFMGKFAESTGKHFCYMMANQHHGVNQFSDGKNGSLHQFEDANNSAAQQQCPQDTPQQNDKAVKPL